MKKLKKIMLFILLISSLLFAYTSVSYMFNDITVTKELDITRETRFDAIKGMTVQGFNSTVTYTIENNGIPKNNVKLIEDDVTIWEVNTMVGLETNKHIYTSDKEITPDNFKAQQIKMEMVNQNAILNVQDEGRIGEKITILIVSESFEPFKNIELIVNTPNGQTMIETDTSGKVTFIPETAGLHDFEINNVIIQNDNINLDIAELNNDGDQITASISDQNSSIGLDSFLTVIIGLIVSSILIFGAILYFSGNDENNLVLPPETPTSNNNNNMNIRTNNNLDIGTNKSETPSNEMDVLTKEIKTNTSSNNNSELVFATIPKTIEKTINHDNVQHNKKSTTKTAHQLRTYQTKIISATPANELYNVQENKIDITDQLEKIKLRSQLINRNREMIKQKMSKVKPISKTNKPKKTTKSTIKTITKLKRTVKPTKRSVKPTKRTVKPTNKKTFKSTSKKTVKPTSKRTNKPTTKRTIKSTSKRTNKRTVRKVTKRKKK